MMLVTKDGVPLQVYGDGAIKVSYRSDLGFLVQLLLKLDVIQSYDHLLDRYYP